MKKPAFQFYPGDWRKDQNLSRASLQAKGAMIEIMCLAFECDKRGILATDGKPWSIDEIAHAIGGDKMVNISAIEELLKLNVLKKNKKNFIFSSRMVKDSKILEARKKGGELGKDHGIKGKEFGKLGGRPVNKPPLLPPPSSSSSSSTSVIQQQLLLKRIAEEPFFEMFRRATGKHITDDELFHEIGKFRNKYPNIHPNQAGALVNTWIANIGKTSVAETLTPEKPKIWI
jgi:hypothetical protein